MLAGIDPRGPQTGETVEWLCNVFMDSREAKRVAGELMQRAQNDYLATCKRLAKFFGRTRSLQSLGPLEFGTLTVEMQKKWGPTTVNNELGRINVVLNYAYAIEAVDKPIRTGPDFFRVSRKAMLRHRRQQPTKLFTADQVRSLVYTAPTLLGLIATL